MNRCQRPPSVPMCSTSIRLAAGETTAGEEFDRPPSKKGPFHDELLKFFQDRVPVVASLNSTSTRPAPHDDAAGLDIGSAPVATTSQEFAQPFEKYVCWIFPSS